MINYSELDYLKNEYDYACEYIHVSSYGLHFPLGNLSSNDRINFGPSDYGLSRPFQLLLISLLSTTTSFLTLDYTVDRAIQIKMLNLVVDSSLEEIANIDKEIREDFFGQNDGEQSNL